MCKQMSLADFQRNCFQRSDSRLDGAPGPPFAKLCPGGSPLNPNRSLCFEWKWVWFWSLRGSRPCWGRSMTCQSPGVSGSKGNHMSCIGNILLRRLWGREQKSSLEGSNRSLAGSTRLLPARTSRLKPHCQTLASEQKGGNRGPHTLNLPGTSV